MKPGPQLQRLAQPPPERMVAQIPGSGNRPAVDYLPHYHVQQILLYQLGAYNWSVQQIIPTGLSGDDAWVCVGCIDTVIDGHPFGVAGVGLGRDPKTAESDSLKRAASKIGVGLSLWAKGGDAYWLPTQWKHDQQEGGEATS